MCGSLMNAMFLSNETHVSGSGFSLTGDFETSCPVGGRGRDQRQVCNESAIMGRRRGGEGRGG